MSEMAAAVPYSSASAGAAGMLGGRLFHGGHNCSVEGVDHALQVAAALAGGTFELGDRVACLRGTGSPPLAARGTVVGEAPACGTLVITAVALQPPSACVTGQCVSDQGCGSRDGSGQRSTAAVPAFRHRACRTIAGIYDDDAVEVLFDEPFAEGTDLHGKARGRHGGMLPAAQLLNLSKPQAVAATGHFATRAHMAIEVPTKPCM